MAITKDRGRQELIVMHKTISYSDPTSDAAAAEAVFDVPYGAVVVGGEVVVKTAFDSTTSDVLDLGDGDDDDRYTATPVDLQSTGRTALTLTGYTYTAADTIDLEWTAGSTGTATAGEVDIMVMYYVEGRAGFEYSNQSSDF